MPSTHKDVPGSIRETPLVVISYYDRRGTACLLELLASMASHDAGMPFEALVVVNQTRDVALEPIETPYPLEITHRANLGMNIGAWDEGWRLKPGRRAYLFLQDECLVVRENWLSAFVERCDDPDIGLVGECFNPAWEAAWPRLKALHAGSTMPDHCIDGRPAPRVETYLHHLQRWSIEPGACGRHLRALVWAASGETLQRIDGFPQGSDYGECIAAEIGVSRKVEAAGERLAQVRAAPFYFVRHREWNQDVPGGPFNHAKKVLSEALWDSPRRAELDAEALRVQELLHGALHTEDDVTLAIAALLRKLEDRERHIEALTQAYRAKQPAAR